MLASYSPTRSRCLDFMQGNYSWLDPNDPRDPIEVAIE
jgi:hypothetical protein